MSERHYSVGLGGEDLVEPVPEEPVVEPVVEEVEPTKAEVKAAKAEAKAAKEAEEAPVREVAADRHAARMLEDPDYAEAFKDEE